MTASSYYSSSYYPYYGRLNEARGAGGWCPTTRQGPRTDYLQVDLGAVHSVCAVATQGASNIDERTTSYILRRRRSLVESLGGLWLCGQSLHVRRKEVVGVKSACDVLLHTIMRSVFRTYYSSCQRKRGNTPSNAESYSSAEWYMQTPDTRPSWIESGL